MPLVACYHPLDDRVSSPWGERQSNLTSDGSNNFSYDIENHLISKGGGTNATITYDPKRRLNQITGSLGTTRFLAIRKPGTY